MEKEGGKEAAHICFLWEGGHATDETVGREGEQEQGEGEKEHGRVSS